MVFASMLTAVSVHTQAATQLSGHRYATTFCIGGLVAGALYQKFVSKTPMNVPYWMPLITIGAGYLYLYNAYSQDNSLRTTANYLEPLIFPLGGALAVLLGDKALQFFAARSAVAKTDTPIDKLDTPTVKSTSLVGTRSKAALAKLN